MGPFDYSTDAQEFFEERRRERELAELKLQGILWVCPTCGTEWRTTVGHERCIHCQPQTDKEIKRMHLHVVPGTVKSDPTPKKGGAG